MPLRRALCQRVSPHAGVRMRVRSPVTPASPPRLVIDDHGVPVPVKTIVAPAPRPEKSPDRYAESEANRPAHNDARSRREEHNSRIVIWHHDKTRIHGRDGDIWPAANDNLAITSQVSKISRSASLPLDRVHHVLLLRQESI